MQYEQVYVLGDLHGKWNLVQEFIMANSVANALILQVGDCGVGFQPVEKDMEQLNILHTVLNKYNTQLFCIRGNHDNPAYFHGERMDFPHIHLLADYSILPCNGKRILAIGGAISIDRKRRQEGENYWMTEEFCLQPDLIGSVSDIDVVITHSAPEFAFPPGYGPRVKPFLADDASLAEDLLNERAEHSALYHQLRKQGNALTHWFYGHFHQHQITLYEGTAFILLDIGQFYRVNW